MAMLKKQIKDIFTPGVIGVSPDTLVCDALKIMETRAISCVVVLDDDRPVGMFTERNIVKYTAKHGLDFAEKTIRGLMRSPVLSATGEMYVYEAFNLLVSHNIRHLVVVDEHNRAVGVVTQSNLLQHLGYEYFIEIKKVSKIMTSTLYTIPGDYTLYQALTDMAQKTISCVIIAEHQFPRGILTERDVGRLVTNKCDIHHIPVEEVMSQPIQTVLRETPLYEVAWQMRKHNIRRVVVVDRQGRIEGLTTQSDVVKGLEGKYIDILKQIIQEQHAALQATSQELYEKTVYLDNMLRSSLDMGVIATDINLRIAYFNPAAEKILSYESGEVLGQDVRNIHCQEHVELSRFNTVLERVQEKKRHLFDFKRNGRYIQGAVTGIWDTRDRLIGFVAMMQDITERKQAEQTIQFLAYHDALTGLPNRVLFQERLTLELAHAERHNQPLALMEIDLDMFKEVNDTLGHHAGDILLQEIAGRLKHVLRKSDTIARIGGDEFVLLLPQIQHVENAVTIAGKILSTFETPVDIEEEQIYASMSIGISIYPFHSEDSDELLKIADRAMYTAKELHRKNQRSNFHLAPLS